MRTWLHCTCANTPLMNSSGFVTATDSAGTMVQDLQRLLDHAAGRGVRVVISLFNGALMSPQLKGLITVDGKMQSCACRCCCHAVQRQWRSHWHAWLWACTGVTLPAL